MKKLKTIQDFLCAGLLAQGYDEVVSTTRRARTFQFRDDRDNRFFVGKAGSLRIGRAYSDSLAVPTKRRNEILDAGHAVQAAHSARSIIDLNDLGL